MDTYGKKKRKLLASGAGLLLSLLRSQSEPTDGNEKTDKSTTSVLDIVDDVQISPSTSISKEPQVEGEQDICNSTDSPASENNANSVSALPL